MATVIPGRLRGRVESANHGLLIVCLGIASTQMAWAVVVPVLPAYVESFGAGATELGLVVAMFGLGRLVVNVPAGLLSERVDRRRLLLAGIGGVVLFQTATAFAPSLGVLLGLRVATGLAGGVAITSGMALVADLTTSDGRGRAMAMLQGFQLLGGSLGPVIGGAVATVAGTRAPFLVCGAAALSVLVFGGRRLLAAAVLVEDDEPTESSARSGPLTGAAPVPAPVAGLARNIDFLAVCAVAFAVFFNRFGGTQSLVPLIAYTVVGLSVGELGTVLGAVMLCNIVAVTFVGGLSDRVGRKTIIVPGLALIALGLPIYALTDSPGWFVLATMITGIANGFSGPTPAAYMADVVPRTKRGRAVGIYRTFGDLAGVIGPISLGWMVDRAGYQSAVWSLSGLVAVTAVGFAVVARESVGVRLRPAPVSPASP